MFNRLPLYTEYIPYAYEEEWMPTRWKKDPITGKNRRIPQHYVYNPVLNRDYSIYEYHNRRESDRARAINRANWYEKMKNPWLVADNRHDWVKGVKIAKFVGSWWKRYKEKKLGEAYDRVMSNVSINRKRPLNSNSSNMVKTRYGWRSID